MRIKSYLSTMIASSFMILLVACQPQLLPTESSGASPAPLEQSLPGTVVATGLNGPQDVYVADDGSIWVVDSGMGGDMQFTAADPASGGTRVATFGMSAQLVQVADGTQEIVTMLPSAMVGEGRQAETAGGGRIAVMDGEVYVTVGEWQDSFSSERPELSGTVVKLVDGSPTLVADTYALEASDNPGGFGLHSHPYGLVSGPDGMLYIADAGANALLRVNPADGVVETVAAFAGVPGMPFPNGGRNGAMESDPVPTGLVVADDGTTYVTLLPGFPFIPGSSKVVQVSPDGTVSDYATGLTTMTDLTQGPDGAMYGVQFAIFGEQGPQFGSGAIVRIQEGDASEIVLGNLPFPTAIDFDMDGNAYITINGIGAPGSGQAIKVDGLTDMSGQPMAMR